MRFVHATFSLLAALALACSPSQVPNGPTSTQASPSAEATKVASPPVGQRGEVRREELGDGWPLTVESAVLACVDSSGPRTGLITLRADGVTYALNGFARSRAASRGWQEIDPIWKDNTAIPGTKKDIGPLIQRGLALC